MIDWVSIAGVGTAVGTLVLAFATFGATRSANRAARVAERALAEGIRPLLLPSNWDDSALKVRFADNVWLVVRGGRADVKITDEAVYVAFSVRNAGTGIAVLHGWNVLDEPQAPISAVTDFTVLRRDIYIPVRDPGFCQVAIRDPASAAYRRVTTAVNSGGSFSVDVLYGDIEGSQRVVSRFSIMRAATEHGESEWLVSVSRHWNLDAPHHAGSAGLDATRSNVRNGAVSWPGIDRSGRLTRQS